MKDPHRPPQINALGGAKLTVYGVNLPYFDGIDSVCMACSDHHPLPNTVDLLYFCCLLSTKCIL